MSHRNPIAAAFVLVVALLGPSPSVSADHEPQSRWRGGWIELAPAEAGYDRERFEAAVDEIGQMRGIQGLLVLRQGYLVAERYWRGGSRDVPHNLKSASKSILSALAGIAMERGHFDLDQPVVDLLTPLGGTSPPSKRGITVRHLLQMTSGLRPKSYQAYDAWVRSKDWVRAAFADSLESDPGTQYAYNTANTHLLSAIITATSGQNTRTFATKHLFGPMGVRIHEWQTDPQGIPIGGNNLWLLPRDLAKFGQLYLDQGRWGNRQLVPRAWVRDSTAPKGTTSHPAYGDYGYLWWTPYGDGTFAAVGYGGQYVVVSPGDDTVIVVLSTQDSKGDHWEQSLFSRLKDRLAASLVRRDKPAAASTQARVNLREEPGTETAVLAVLPEGTSVHQLDRQDDWLAVVANGHRGWVHADYVSDSRPPRPAGSTAPIDSPEPPRGEAPSNDTAARVSQSPVERIREQAVVLSGLVSRPPPLSRHRVTSVVNFRRSPSLSGELIGQLVPGTEFEARERSEAWLMTEINGQTGWVHSSFTTLTGEPSIVSLWEEIAGEVSLLVAEIDAIDGGPLPGPPPAGTRVQPNTAHAAVAEMREERDRLRNTLRQMEQRAAAIRADHEGEIAELRRQAEMLTRTADEVSVTLEELLDTRDRQQQALMGADATSAQLRAELGARDAEIAQLKATLVEVRDSADALAAHTRKLQAENRQLNGEVAILQSLEEKRKQDQEAAEAKLAALEQDVVQALSDLDRFKTQSTALERKNRDIEARLAATEEKNVGLEQSLKDGRLVAEKQRRRITNLEHDNSTLGNRFSVAQERAAEWQEKFRAASTTAKQQQAAIEAGGETSARLQAQLAEKEKGIVELEARLGSEQQLVADLRAELTQLSNDSENSAARLAAQTELNARLQADLGEAQDERDQLQQALSENQADKAALETRLAEALVRLENRDRQLLAARTTESDLATALKEARSGLEEGETKLASHVANRARMERLLEEGKREITDLEAQLEAVKAVGDQRSEALLAAGDKISLLTQQLETSRSEADSGRTALEETRTIATGLRQELASREKADRDLRGRHAELKGDFARLQRRHDDLTREGASLREQLERQASTVDSLRSRITETSAAASAAEQAHLAARSLLDDAHRALGIFWTGQARAFALNAELERAAARSAAQAEQLQRENGTLKEAMAASEITIAGLHRDSARDAAARDALQQEKHQLQTRLAAEEERSRSSAEALKSHLAENVRLQALVRNLAQEAETSGKALSELRKADATQRQRLAEMQQLADQRLTELDRLQTQANAGKKQVSELKRRLAIVEKENQKYATTLQSLLASRKEQDLAWSTEREQLTAENGRLSDALRAAVDASRQQSAVNETQAARLAELEALITTGRNDIAEMQSIVARNLEEQGQIAAALTDQQQQNRDLTAQLAGREAFISEQAAALAGLRAENAKLKQEQRQQEETLLALREAHETELARLQTSLDDARQLGQTRADDLQKTRGQLARAQQAQAEGREEATTRHAQLVALEDDNARLKAELQQQAASLKTARETLLTLCEQQGAERDRAEELELTHAAQLAKAKDQLALVQQALSEERERVTKRDARNVALADENARLSANLEQRNAALDSAQAELLALRDEQRDEVARLQKRLNNAAQLAQAHAAETANLDVTLAEARRELTERREQNATMNAQNTALQERLDEQAMELSVLRSVDQNLKSTLAQVSDLQQLADAREADSEALIKDIEQLHTLDRQRQQEIDVLKERSRTQEAALHTARLTIQALQSQAEPAGSGDGRTVDRGTPGDSTGATAPESQGQIPGLATREESVTAVAVALPAPAAPAVESGGAPPAVATVETLLTGTQAPPLVTATEQSSSDQPPVNSVQNVWDETITQFVHAWAEAWSRQDVDGYLDHYAANFRPGKGISRDTWAEQRRVRLTRPKSIAVTVSQFAVRPVDENRASVTFEQAYRANHYRDRVTKTLELRRQGGKWKIVREVSR